MIRNLGANQTWSRLVAARSPAQHRAGLRLAGCHDRNAPARSSVLAVMVATIRRERLFPTPVGKIPQGILGATRLRDIGAAPASAAPPWSRALAPGPRIRTRESFCSRDSFFYPLRHPPGSMSRIPTATRTVTTSLQAVGLRTPPTKIPRPGDCSATKGGSQQQ